MMETTKRKASRRRTSMRRKNEVNEMSELIRTFAKSSYAFQICRQPFRNVVEGTFLLG